MRLTQNKVTLLKEQLALLSKEAKLYLFDFRVDDGKRGGDIDLLVVSKKLTKRDIRHLCLDFFKVFGDQKMDILLDDGRFINSFHKLISQKALQV